MSSSVALPPVLREKLVALAWRIRCLRLIRGASLVLLAAVLTAGAALLLDAWLDLPAWMRIGLFVGWWSLTVFLGFVAVIRPLSHPLRPEALAALIEEKYPDLGERLTSAVELANPAGTTHGAPALIALLVQETEARSERLSFVHAFPARWIGGLAVVAVIALAGALAPAFVWPHRYAELSRRFFTPWHAPEAGPRFVLAVTPGDTFAGKGRPLVFTVQVQPTAEGAALPTTCALVCTGEQGSVRRLMRADRPDAFSFELDKVAGDFSYRVEAGACTSETYQVTAVEPVELGEGTAIAVTPPEYAKATLPPQQVEAFTDVAALQHSRLRFTFGFSRVATAAYIEWTPAGGDGKSRPAPEGKKLALELVPDRRSATIELPATATASLKLVLEAEHGIRTEIADRTLTVQVDQPPAFLNITNKERPKTEWRVQTDATGTIFRPEREPGREDLKAVLPYDTVPIEVDLADDIGVDRAELEYRINDGKPVTEAIPIEGAGTRQAKGKYAFRLGEKSLKEGDILQYRLKATDNRRVPEAGLEPQVVYYPFDRWLTLKIARQAESLKQQEILAQRDQVNKRLDEIEQDLRKEERGVYKLGQESRNQDSLKPDQARELQQLRQENRSNENALRELAREMAETPAMQRLADKAMDVADKEMHQSEQALKASEKERRPEPRQEQMRKADKELDTAMQRLQELRRENERLAQERVAQNNLEMLAERQKQLADRSPEKPDQAKQEQKDLSKDLQKLTDQSEPLRDAMDAARAQQAKQLADKARELAKSQRELAQDSKETRKPAQGQMADLARQQKELADRADRLAKETQAQMQAAKTKPLQPESARKAAEALGQENAGEALQQQDKSLAEMDRISNAMERGLERQKQESPTPQQAEQARQLAREQRELRKAVQNAMNTASDQKARQQSKEQLTELTRQQNELADRAERLAKETQTPMLASRTPPLKPDAARKAAETLQQQTVGEALPQQEQSQREMERVAAALQKAAERPRPETPNPQQADQARQLARQQRELRDAVRQLTKSQADQSARQQARQQELQKETGSLTEQMNRLAQEASRSPAMQQALSQAGTSTKQAQGSMQQAQDQQRQQNQGRTGQSQQQAAEQLDRAAEYAEQAVQKATSPQSPLQGPQTGQMLQQAQGKMQQAQDQLSQGQPQPAQQAMQQAAQALQQAAQQVGQPQQPGKPGPQAQTPPLGAEAGGQPDLSMFGEEAKKYAGKRWGELPGELRTRIVQDLKARYGEDYARIIKLYFEQIADTKK
jgi:hypothetical protein